MPSGTPCGWSATIGLWEKVSGGKISRCTLLSSVQLRDAEDHHGYFPNKASAIVVRLTVNINKMHPLLLLWWVSVGPRTVTGSDLVEKMDVVVVVAAAHAVAVVDRCSC